MLRFDIYDRGMRSKIPHPSERFNKIIMEIVSWLGSVLSYDVSNPISYFRASSAWHILKNMVPRDTVEKNMKVSSFIHCFSDTEPHGNTRSTGYYCTYAWTEIKNLIKSTGMIPTRFLLPQNKSRVNNWEKDHPAPQWNKLRGTGHADLTLIPTVTVDQINRSTLKIFKWRIDIIAILALCIVWNVAMFAASLSQARRPMNIVSKQIVTLT